MQIDKTVAAVTACIALAAGVSGCGENADDAVKRVTNAYLEAIQDVDGDTYCDLLSPRAQAIDLRERRRDADAESTTPASCAQAFEDVWGSIRPDQRLRPTDDMTVEIVGDRATATAAATATDSDKATFELIRIDGRWRVEIDPAGTGSYIDATIIGDCARRWNDSPPPLGASFVRLLADPESTFINAQRAREERCMVTIALETGFGVVLTQDNERVAWQRFGAARGEPGSDRRNVGYTTRQQTIELDPGQLLPGSERTAEVPRTPQGDPDPPNSAPTDADPAPPESADPDAGTDRGAETLLCPDVPDIGPTGPDPADAVLVTTTAASCTVADAVIRDYTKASVTNPNPGAPVIVRGYACTDDYPKVRCAGPDDERLDFEYG